MRRGQQTTSIYQIPQTAKFIHKTTYFTIRLNLNDPTAFYSNFLVDISAVPEPNFLKTVSLAVENDYYVSVEHCYYVSVRMVIFQLNC